MANLVRVCRFPSIGAVDSHSLRYESYARMQHFVRRTFFVPFRRVLGDVRPEIKQRLFTALHGILVSYFGAALL
jgi:hypothetical protein